ncbi:hypothetical protein [Microbacterium immunditiarum]|uniref:Uncharacterized protein n=1 Tax=Microbacterium immunditiarum TaxID=337480 RepID=A0A7Y9GKJ5_9MICO|nr:hypothetical protein [Microbacterium immunditiarum]NYE18119.1 hypothetical protein [Microbacterium immunditiarum]
MASKYAGTIEFSDLLFDRHAQMSMIFLRGHLLLEQALTTIIELRGERAKVVLDRASFNAKLNICDGFGLVDEDLATAVQLVNRERNHLAHRLDALVTFDRVSALVAKMPERIRTAVDDVVSLTPDELTAEVQRRVAKARKRGANDEHIRALEMGFTQGAQTTELLKGLFLVLAMGLGGVIQRLRYEANYGEKLDSFKWACAIAEIEETGATPESIRARLALPDPPDPRDALGELFRSA